MRLTVLFGMRIPSVSGETWLPESMLHTDADQAHPCLAPEIRGGKYVFRGFIPENTHMGNVIQAEKVLCVCMYMHMEM